MPSSRMARAVKTKNKVKSAAGLAKGSKGSKVSMQPKAGPGPGHDRLADEERNALALKSINESVYDWNVETDEVYFSPSLRVMLGLKPDQPITREGWADLIHPDDRTVFKYTLAEHLKGNTPRFSMELRYRDGASNWRWARQAGIAVRGPDGRALRMVGAAGDITDAKRDDEAMVASADLLKVMSRSTFELQTVLDAAVNSATRLCDADAALIFRREDGHYRLAAESGLTAEQKIFLGQQRVV